MNSPSGQNIILIYDSGRSAWLYFRNPIRVFAVTEIKSVIDTLYEVENRCKAGNYHAAGFISYEASPAFDPVLTTHPPTGFPLLWFGLYQAPTRFDFPAPGPHQAQAPAWQADITAQSYGDAIHRIKNYIRDGDTYQVNFSYRLRSSANFDPWEFFTRMIHAQGYGFGAYADIGDQVICSASPELFFRLQGDTLESRPMKGTRERGLYQSRDLANREWLAASEKDQAENLMILDMVRNDMGRIAATGSVRTHDIFRIEKYPTVWQLTSCVTAETKENVTDIFRALFPPASITGAPKARTMAIIRELESSPRKLYTGAIGFFSPERRAQFNVAIRTAVVDRLSGVTEYGIGGGIVWDSSDTAELREAQIKARVLTHVLAEFSLLETLLWTPDAGYFLLEAHLERLASSADYFSRPIDIPELRARLARMAQQLPPHCWRIRLLVPAAGDPVLEPTTISETRNDYRMSLANTPVNAEEDVFLYHKTTQRAVYHRALAAAPGYDDVLLWNSRGEITESCIANVVVESHGALYTPPVECGLLAGTYRDELLRVGRIREQIIRVEDLGACENVYLINSVRRMWRVKLYNINNAFSPVVSNAG
jgi:para-aminobenzoate synthetase/4-amino-4-deoxychorismate lyase